MTAERAADVENNESIDLVQLVGELLKCVLQGLCVSCRYCSGVAE